MARPKSINSKINQVRSHLNAGLSLTVWQAVEKYKTNRLPAIIKSLRDQGMNIKTEYKHGKDGRYAVYSL